MFLIILLLVGWWLAWRIWRFTILPALHPKRVKELPYWIPCTSSIFADVFARPDKSSGHAFPMLYDLDGRIAYGREFFKNTDQTFSVTVFGREIHIMTSSTNINAVLRDPQAFDYAKQLTYVMSRFGISDEAIRIIHDKPSPNLYKYGNLEPNPRLDTLFVMGEKFMRRQLNPGSLWNDFEATFLGEIDSRLQWNAMSPKAILTSNQHSNQRSVSLLKLVQQTVMTSTTIALFGPKILEIDPDLVENFHFFDENVWMFLFKVPPPWSNAVMAAKARLCETIETYLRLPKDQRIGACWLMSKVEMEHGARGIDTRDISRSIAMIYWAFMTNLWRITFWVSAYLLHDQELLKAIRDEIDPFTQNYSTPSSLHHDLSGCKHFNSVFNEVLRITNSSISMRETPQPTTTALGEVLPAGAHVMLIHRQILMNKAAWGGDAESFNPRRFVDDEALLRSKSFTPYGGGPMLCPGRFMARGETMVFIALLITRFKVVTTQPKPRVDPKSGAGVGVLGVKKGDDSLLLVSPRERPHYGNQTL